jgi:hypothetical protein
MSARTPPIAEWRHASSGFHGLNREPAPCSNWSELEGRLYSGTNAFEILTLASVCGAIVGLGRSSSLLPRGQREETNAFTRPVVLLKQTSAAVIRCFFWASRSGTALTTVSLRKNGCQLVPRLDTFRELDGGFASNVCKLMTIKAIASVPQHFQVPRSRFSPAGPTRCWRK